MSLTMEATYRNWKTTPAPAAVHKHSNREQQRHAPRRGHAPRKFRSPTSPPSHLGTAAPRIRFTTPYHCVER